MHSKSNIVSMSRIPITNWFLVSGDKKRRRRRQTTAEGGGPVGTTRNVEVAGESDGQDYPDYIDFYRDEMGCKQDTFSWLVLCTYTVIAKE